MGNKDFVKSCVEIAQRTVSLVHSLSRELESANTLRAFQESISAFRARTGRRN
jgi:hypothetical protein